MNNYVTTALTALARAGMKSNPYLGHFGSAMLAGHFLSQEELGLSTRTVSAILDCLPLLIASEPDIFNENEEEEEPDADLINQLREYLLAHVGRLSRSGHVAIVGMYALRGLQTDPSTATPSHVNGIIKLLEAYGKERPEPRYYRYSLEYNDVDIGNAQISRYGNATDALALAVSEMSILYPNTEIAGVYYYFVGEKLHGLTHAHALYELERIGEYELVARALPAHQIQTVLNRVEPPDTQLISGTSSLTPEDPEFWRLASSFRHELGLPHALKRSYTLLRARQAGIEGFDNTALQKLSYVLQRW